MTQYVPVAVRSYHSEDWYDTVCTSCSEKLTTVRTGMTRYVPVAVRSYHSEDWYDTVCTSCSEKLPQ